MRNFGRASGAALGLVAFMACGGGKKEAGTAATPSPALPAELRDVAQANDAARSPKPGASAQPEAEEPLRFSGEFVSSMQSEVAARISGRVARVFADEGQRVTRGQRLLQLETEYLALDVQHAQADLSRTTAALREAERDFERKKELLAKGSVPRATHDRAQSTFEQAQAARESAESAVATARRRLGDAVVSSPVDGVVVRREADLGERVGDSTVVFVLAQTAPLKLRFKVPERHLGSIRPGDAVRAQVDPYPDETFEGKVSVIGGSVDPQTRTFAIEAEFQNRDGRLKPGLFARVELGTRG